MIERDPEDFEVAQQQAEHTHTWAAEPTGDDAHRYVCTECGETKSEPPTA